MAKFVDITQTGKTGKYKEEGITRRKITQEYEHRLM
jgi:hypothetical protein